jgi:hypothetical protein
MQTYNTANTLSSRPTWGIATLRKLWWASWNVGESWVKQVEDYKYLTISITVDESRQNLFTQIVTMLPHKYKYKYF